MKKSKKAKPTARRKFTKSALADALGISRQALNVHLKAPDAPRVDDVDAWQIYLAANGRIGTAPEDLRRAIAEKRLAIMEETRRKQARENEVESGKLISAADAQRQANEAGGYMFSELERFVRELPPALAGLSTDEVAKRLRIEIERMRTELKLKMEQVGK